MAIYLGCQLPDTSSSITRGKRRATYSLLFALLQVGFAEQTSRLVSGELLPHLSTLTWHSQVECQAVYLCCTFLGVASTGCYPAPCPVELGLSSCKIAGAILHAAIRLTHMRYFIYISSHQSNIYYHIYLFLST
ncbi:hypothetical protein SAMN02745195_01217 [Thermoanaerobacter uzonensis DSM 18761]|uniref:Uncharacterized protein n=1 Tax=Thermoanaerobacter uzonensis DSM 18761 TaxID=1123369 RepID=A0A1M4WMM9_9THEO|nr:hypothetical protein SAMN02745195_01217 [Thermoanaerobacter uzonensis DSM 18761]